MNWRANFTALTALSSTCSGDMRSFFSMWIGEVAMKVWMRDRTAGFSASAARSMSRGIRARQAAHDTVLDLARQPP